MWTTLQEEALFLKEVSVPRAGRENWLDPAKGAGRDCSELLVDSFLLNDSILPQSGKGDVCIPAKGKRLGFVGLFFFSFSCFFFGLLFNEL